LVKDLDQLEACLLNAQRTVQAFRAAYSEETLDLVRTADKFFDEAQQLTRERDNARAALAECQKLNATLREEMAAGKKRWNRSFQLNVILDNKRNELKEQLAAATAQRDQAMFYARHRAMECAQMENADCECTCGLTELREEIK
jgi:hypothetical protein